MHARVEVLTPIYAQEIKNEIADFLEIIIADEAKAWDLKSDGTYVQRNKKIESDTHKVMMKKTIDRDSENLS
jgi:polyphosphate kinase